MDKLSRLVNIVVKAIIFIGVIPMMLPLVWMILMSLSSRGDMVTDSLLWLPNPIKWSNYPESLKVLPFHLFYKNTILLSVFSTVGAVFSTSLVAYGFARFQFPGREIIFIVMLSTIMLPGVVLMIPSFVLFRYLGWLDTLKPLIIPNFLALAPGAVFLFRQQMRKIPGDTIDAAKLDGCGPIRVYFQIVLPHCLPIIGIVSVMHFIAAWNDLMGPLIYLNTMEKKTVSLGLTFFQNQYTNEVGLMMAASIIAMIPLIIIFIFTQKQIIKDGKAL
jgi:ABC-type glycerol-3-phosphate transport system permease component